MGAARQRRAQCQDERLAAKIRIVHAASRGSYGSPRVSEALKQQGERGNEKRVARIMSERGIAGQAKRKYRATTESNHVLPVAENLLRRQFSASAPNQAWVSDITAIYCAHAFRKLLSALGIVQSMSRKANCWDNAVAESFFHSFKVEQVRGRVYDSREHAQTAVSDYILGFYNALRLHSSLGYLTPNAYARRVAAA